MKWIFFNNPKPRQFQYKPRYYNAQKEELNRKIEQHHLTQEQSEEERIRIKMQNDWERQRSKREDRQSSSRKLIILIVLAALLLYIVMR